MSESLSGLHGALRNLRQVWPLEWPGLPAVARACLAQLGLGVELPAARPRIDCLMALARLVEDDCAWRARSGLELAYHNRLHIADTLVALTVLIREQAGLSPDPRAGAPTLWLESLIAMVAHDHLHDGQVNRYAGELEARSCAAIAPTLTEQGLPPSSKQRVLDWIMATDPSVVAEHHRQIRQRPFSLGDPDCLRALINEADILVSALPEFDRTQTEALALERRQAGVDDPDRLLTFQARREFLEQVAIFSSGASRRLGIDRLRDRQLRKLARVR